MSLRAGVTFGGDIKEDPVRRKLRELEEQIRRANAELSDLEVRTMAATQMVTEMGHDALFMIEQVGTIAGVQWTATQKLTLTMIEQAFLAANKSLEMISIGAPMMAPWVLAAYGSLMALQIMAYKELQAKGERASAEYYQAQQNLQILLRFM